jgi:sulfatase maturation enzyme AslB (radical SAM superfamily)
MHCPRLNHYVRFNFNGTVSRCGHMVIPPEFNTLEELESSQWLATIKKEFEQDHWPKECVRCQQTESINSSSIRLNAINFHKLQFQKHYLIVGGVLDNICNSACQTCNENLSTKIGGLRTKDYPVVDNSSKFWNLPLDRVTHLDINGGEPSASKNYKNILANLPKNIRSLRVNTNCSLIIEELADIVARGVKVTVTVSLDGIDTVHDYVRWPIKWNKFYQNLMTYKNMGLHELNTWTTVSALNIGDFNNILAFVKEHELDHSWALLNIPDELNVKYTNTMTEPYADVIPNQIAVDRNNQQELDQYIQKQNQLRGI